MPQAHVILQLDREIQFLGIDLDLLRKVGFLKKLYYGNLCANAALRILMYLKADSNYAL